LRKLANEELGHLSQEQFQAADKFPFVLVLDNVRSHHNVGSVFRTADGFAASGIYICGFTPQPPHREIHKTALGSENSVAWWHYDSTLDAVNGLKADGYLIVAVEQTDQPVLLQNFKPEQKQKVAFVLGNEITGVDETVVQAADVCLEIPQFGTKHSLNISVAAAVVMWHFVQQRLS
jgi:tRNA G18 (ribose-2'-O)-methylase SpoU